MSWGAGAGAAERGPRGPGQDLSLVICPERGAGTGLGGCAVNRNTRERNAGGSAPGEQVWGNGSKQEAEHLSRALWRSSAPLGEGFQSIK